MVPELGLARINQARGGGGGAIDERKEDVM
jgi:hypothetical protein